MKKAMWILSGLSLILTGAAMPFLPETVPMHFNVLGEVDRWGAKYECFILPAVLLVMSLLFRLMISKFEKKAADSAEEKERVSLTANAKVMKLAGVVIAAFFAVMQALMLYAAVAQTSVEMVKVLCVLIGSLLIVLGNFMPKTRKNAVVGLRIKWSMYNDTTWMKSNRFGAVVMVIAGILMAATGLLAKPACAGVLVIIWVLAAVLIQSVYSYKVYREELKKEKSK